MDVSLTDDGFLTDCDDWSPGFAQQRANQLNIGYSEQVQLLVQSVRQFYIDTQVSPANRALLKIARVALVNDSLSSIDLIDLVSNKPALDCARLAGIPRPKNCF